MRAARQAAERDGRAPTRARPNLEAPNSLKATANGTSSYTAQRRRRRRLLLHPPSRGPDEVADTEPKPAKPAQRTRGIAIMPGIFPMKVIKVGNSAQSRVAQACDRCRSKKIRCDGVRPTCSQCATVGFECRTSDKLSRRAFPRGYTESLEERVRQLETEVRELKDLLDEKDEKMDILCATLGNPQRRPSAASQPPPQPPDQSKASPAPSAKEDLFRIQGSPLLLGAENSESYFMGPSSGRSFVCKCGVCVLPFLRTLRRHRARAFVARKLTMGNPQKNPPPKKSVVQEKAPGAGQAMQRLQPRRVLARSGVRSLDPGG